MNLATNKLKLILSILILIPFLPKNTKATNAYLFKGKENIPSYLSFESSYIRYKNFEKNKNHKRALELFPSPSEKSVNESIKGGNKLYEWIKLINAQKRDDQIKLSDPSRRQSYPVHSPKAYSASTIAEDLKQLQKKLPGPMLKVIFGKEPISNNLPIDKKEFIKFSREVVEVYRTSVRWQTVIKPYIHYYKSRRKNDVRGFYSLRKIHKLNEKLQNFANLSANEQKALKESLLGLCFNRKYVPELCREQLNQSIKENKLIEFKDKFWAFALKNWKDFFEISNPREDIIWENQNHQILRIPFKDTKDQVINEFIKKNVEDEFKNEEFRLEVEFVNDGPNTASIRFKANTTPHVVGGNIIVMDANTNPEEYSNQWTIRHEFGHILRLPDCYVEFFDEEKEMAITYQLDTADLMCSKAGNFNQRIFNELKRVYDR